MIQQVHIVYLSDCKEAKELTTHKDGSSLCIFLKIAILIFKGVTRAIYYTVTYRVLWGRLFYSLLPVLPYVSKIQTLNSDLKRWIDAFGNKCLRKTVG